MTKKKTQASLSARITINDQNDELNITIESLKNNTKTFLMLLWLLSFTACGFVAIQELIIAPDRDHKLFWFVFVSFWAYFEYSVLKALLWRFRGKEIIRFTKTELHLRKDIWGFEKAAQFDTESITDWHTIIETPQSIRAAYENAYWYCGGEKIAFKYLAKEYRFATQLSPEDAARLVSKLKFFHQNTVKG